MAIEGRPKFPEGRKGMLGAAALFGSAVLLAAGLAIPGGTWLKTAVFAASAALSAWETVFLSEEKLGRTSAGGCAAVFAAAFAMFLLGRGGEGAAAALIFRLGAEARGLAQARISAGLLRRIDPRPHTATVVADGSVEKKPVVRIRAGETVSVSQGERVPLDGVVSSGEAYIDMGGLIGDSSRLLVTEGSVVWAGALNVSGAFTFRVTSEHGESAFERNLKSLESVCLREPELVRRLRRIKRYYAPACLAAALVGGLVAPLIAGADVKAWAGRAAAALVAQAAVLEGVLFAYFAGAARALSQGILFRGADAIETVAGATSAVFEKTGVLTDGKYRVADVHSYGVPADSLLLLAAHAELFSAHPMARAIVEAAGKDRIDASRVSEFREHKGLGVAAVISGRTVNAGSARYMAQLGVTPDLPQGDSSAVFVAVNGIYAGRILLKDTLNPDSKKAVYDLNALGIDRILMFTGDKKEAAAEAAGQVGIQEFYPEFLPDEKLSKLCTLAGMQLEGDKLLYVASAPGDERLFEAADAGIAVGALGCIELACAAGVAVMAQMPSKVAEAVALSRRTNRVAVQGAALALALKALVILLAVFGALPVWASAAADAALSTVLVAHSLRAFGRERSWRKKR